jgi:hypothetical protein
VHIGLLLDPRCCDVTLEDLLDSIRYSTTQVLQVQPAPALPLFTRSSSRCSVEVNRWTQTREAQAEESFTRLALEALQDRAHLTSEQLTELSDRLLPIFAQGFQALQFPPLMGIELDFHGKIGQIRPLRGLDEL